MLARRGWTAIQDITPVDEVWDGVEWVGTTGNIFNGERVVVEAHGAWMTADHLVLTDRGWMCASQSTVYPRGACRLPDGVGAPPSSGEAPRRVAPVYDLVNCGPRSRFTIWAGDAPLIVHNCENATQALARDLMAVNMPEIERQGFDILLSIHDELITETGPQGSAEHLSALMSRCPEWAPGLPLAAAGFECHRYRKD